MAKNIADAAREEIDFVKGELEARKGRWPQIAKDMKPSGWQSYYSWLTKFAQGQIESPNLDTLQDLSSYLKRTKRSYESRAPQ